jgi:hypothetical protein
MLESQCAFKREHQQETLMKSVLAFTAVTLLSAAAALAQTPPPAQSESAQSNAFNQLDADHSGTITAQEAQVVPVVSQSFASADKDHDGSLTQDEFNSSFTIGQPAPQADSPAASPPPR